MARITVEDCLRTESNRFALVRLASRRAKQLLLGKAPVSVSRGNKAIVSALREIADGKVKFRRASDHIQTNGLKRPKGKATSAKSLLSGKTKTSSKTKGSAASH